MAQSYFAVCPPGLEAFLVAELRELGAKKVQAEHAGASFRATRAQLYGVLLGARQPNRLYLRVGEEFRARDAQELYRKVARQPWERWLRPGARLVLDATVSRSGLQGSGQVQDRVFDGIRDRMAQAHLGVARAAASDDEGLSQEPWPKGQARVVIRLHEDRCQLSLDVAGRRLYQRGWRAQTGPAPLRETLASALLTALRWQPSLPLLDPMCGSGTILIEAARAARGLSPRAWSSYALHDWADFDQALWDDARRAWPDQAPDPTPDQTPDHRSEATTWIGGMDQDPRALHIAQQNARRAHVDDLVQWSQAAVSQLAPPAALADRPGLILTNPPYGLRLPRARGKEAPEQQLLRTFAQERFEGWRLGMILPSDFTVEQEGLQATERGRATQGGKPMRLWEITRL